MRISDWSSDVCSSDLVKSIEKLIRQSAESLDREKVTHLRSVKGIGLVTAASVMAYLPELGEVGRHQIAALAGIAPYNDDSGTHKGKRYISGGRFAARRALYMEIGKASCRERVCQYV